MGRGTTNCIWKHIKKAIANIPVLTYYDLEKPVTIQTDMSDVGVGAVLLQNEKPVKSLERLWKKLRSNWKRDESCCVWITQVQRLLLRKTYRIRSSTIRSNQQQASKRSTRKTVKNDAFNTEFWLQNNIQEEQWRTYHIYPTPLLGQDRTQGQFLKRSLTGLNSEFSFS